VRGRVRKPALFVPSFERESRSLAPYAQRIGKQIGLAISLARAIIASPHSHEDESSWYL
jgi:hypothetical protein